MLHGIINVYKEKGFTSHDVVAKLRGIVKQKKIGHTGTLDPDAEGVLPVCLGSATKVCELLTDRDKTYRATLLLGMTTDTQDTSGNVLKERSVTGISEESVRQAIMSFLGDYAQIPPMYSALKVGGKKLYELAREGKEIERQARNVYIHDIQIINIELPRVIMEVTCSKGTYIRTLCHDIGEMLGCGGCMENLLRTAVGRFSLTDSVTLSEIHKMKEEDRLDEILIPVDRVFEQYRKVQIPAELEKKLQNGNPFSLHESRRIMTDGEMVRVYDSKDRFSAVYKYVEKEHWYRPVKMFLQ